MNVSYTVHLRKVIKTRSWSSNPLILVQGSEWQSLSQQLGVQGGNPPCTGHPPISITHPCTAHSLPHWDKMDTPIRLLCTALGCERVENLEKTSAGRRTCHPHPAALTLTLYRNDVEWNDIILGPAVLMLCVHLLCCGKYGVWYTLGCRYRKGRRK